MTDTPTNASPPETMGGEGKAVPTTLTRPSLRLETIAANRHETLAHRAHRLLKRRPSTQPAQASYTFPTFEDAERRGHAFKDQGTWACPNCGDHLKIIAETWTCRYRHVHVAT